MILSVEVKHFIKNTLILTFFFTLVLHLSWGYIAPMFETKTDASMNDLRFQQADVTYLGNIAAAMSLSIGQKDAIGISRTPTNNNQTNAISILEVLANPTLGQQRLIGSNMIAISSYATILSMDIVQLLDNATNREKALDEHITLLKSYYNKTNERLRNIDEQISELGGIITSAGADTNDAKATMQSSYVGYDYTGVDNAIGNYIDAKNRETRARVYLTYLSKFRASYITLQTNTYKLIDTLTNNRDALIKKATIVIPDSGPELIRTLKLIQNEAETGVKESEE